MGGDLAETIRGHPPVRTMLPAPVGCTAWLPGQFHPATGPRAHAP